MGIISKLLFGHPDIVDDQRELRDGELAFIDKFGW